MGRVTSHHPRASPMVCRSALVVLALVIPARTSAQDSTTHSPAAGRVVTLSLTEALQQARANSPAYRQALNDASPARWGVRNAYGSLLPSVLASTDFGYTGSGQSNFGGGFTRPTSAFLTSGYSLGLQWQLSGRSLQAPEESGGWATTRGPDPRAIRWLGRGGRP